MCRIILRSAVSHTAAVRTGCGAAARAESDPRAVGGCLRSVGPIAVRRPGHCALEINPPVKVRGIVGRLHRVVAYHGALCMRVGTGHMSVAPCQREVATAGGLGDMHVC